MQAGNTWRINVHGDTCGNPSRGYSYSTNLTNAQIQSASRAVCSPFLTLSVLILRTNCEEKFPNFKATSLTAPIVSAWSDVRRWDAPVGPGTAFKDALWQQPQQQPQQQQQHRPAHRIRDNKMISFTRRALWQSGPASMAASGIVIKRKTARKTETRSGFGNSKFRGKGGGPDYYRE